MRTIGVLEWILRLAGLAALVLGLLIWTLQLDAVITIHMVFGLAVALTLLIISLLAVLTRGLRIVGVVGIVYAFLLPVFGVNQFRLLPGDLHWLIQALHLLVGIGALVLAGFTSMSYRKAKQGAKPAVG